MSGLLTILPSKLAGLGVATTLVACTAVGSEDTAVDCGVPAIPSAIDAYSLIPSVGRCQLSFEYEAQYPSSAVRDYYATWADANGWTLLDRSVDTWSSDEWGSFLDEENRRVDQWLVHWQSPDDRESLLLVIQHVADRSRQKVYVIRQPFRIIAHLRASMDSLPAQSQSS